MNGKSMSDKLGLGPQRHELKFGSSFMNSKSTSFHTVKYDFKPASVDASKRATVDVGSNHQVTVTVPHLDGSGTAHTVFKGSQRPYQKECVLIIDRDTGEITLEKLSTCIQLKKTRQESSQRHHSSTNLSAGNAANSSNWSSSSENKKTSPPEPSRQRHSSKLPKSLSARVPLNSPLHASPSYTHSHKSPTTSQTNQKSPPQVTSSMSPTTAPGSLPLIGLSDMNDSPSMFGASSNSSLVDFTQSPRLGSPIRVDVDEDESGAVGLLSDSSSNSSSDDSNSSDSDSDSNPSNNDTIKPSIANGQLNGTLSPALSHDNFLNEDLHLSESSGLDSD
ncbi:ELL-associated factor [Lycorma delicatula]|uniref:ELL-associated factor n=1 Tax=Lycorma delicatula TaxID=130591 RepID=UPI003F5195BC